MAFSGIGTLAVCLLFAVANAQFTPMAKGPSCNEVNWKSGNDFLSHEIYCSNFSRCPNGNKVNFTCGNELVFDSSSNNCNYPGAATCRYWTCDSNTIGIRYPHHQCSRRYFECIGPGYKMGNCSEEAHFNMSTGQCESGIVPEGPGCQPTKGTEDNQQCNLMDHRYGDDCKYTVKVSNNSYEDMPCPEKTSFNATQCGCTNLNDNCPKAYGGPRSKIPDRKCQQSYGLTFAEYNNDTGAPQVYSQKEAANLPYVLQNNRVTFKTGEAYYSRSTEPDQSSYLYAYNFNNNQLTPSIGICVTFKANGPTIEPIRIVSNNYFGACSPTVEMTATLVGDTYEVTATVTGMTRYSTTNVTTASGTMSGFLTVGPGSYIDACIYYNGFLNIKLTDKGADGKGISPPMIKNGAQALGSTLCPNQCGFLFGYLLDGIVKKIHIYEGCRDESIFYAY